MKNTQTKTLARNELIRRAKNIRLVLADNDGVMTDTGVYYSEKGEAFKRFSIRDGMGVELLRKADVMTAIITGERSESVERRSEKLKLPYLYLGVNDKRAHLDKVLQETGLALDQIAYIGDDVNDLDAINVISRVGLTGAPGDAMPVVRRSVHYQCEVNGGDGAFREFAEWILGLRQSHAARQD